VQETRRPIHARNISTPGHNRPGPGERQPLIRRRSLDEFDNLPEEDIPSSTLPGGTVLGIHNLAIVMPQFIVSGARSRFRVHFLIPSQVAIVTSIIFKLVDGDPRTESLAELPNTYLGKNGVAWVLRFGGLSTLFGAIFARMVPPTATEKAMRRRLGEMKLLGEEVDP